MAIRFKCEYCERPMKADDRHAGRTAKCNGCGEKVEIPLLTPPETIVTLEQPPRSKAALLKVCLPVLVLFVIFVASREFIKGQFRETLKADAEKALQPYTGGSEVEQDKRLQTVEELTINELTGLSISQLVPLAERAMAINENEIAQEKMTACLWVVIAKNKQVFLQLRSLTNTSKLISGELSRGYWNAESETLRSGYSISKREKRSLVAAFSSMADRAEGKNKEQYSSFVDLLVKYEANPLAAEYEEAWREHFAKNIAVWIEDGTLPARFKTFTEAEMINFSIETSLASLEELRKMYPSLQ